MDKMRKRLRDLREGRSLNQFYIAKIIDTSQQQYSKYESGASELPLCALVRLAKYYGVSTDYLTGASDYKYFPADLNLVILPGITAGAMISEVMVLPETSRAAVIEYIELHKLRMWAADKVDSPASDGTAPS